MPRIERPGYTRKVHKYPKEIRKLHHTCDLRSFTSVGWRRWFYRAGTVQSDEWRASLQRISYRLWLLGLLLLWSTREWLISSFNAGFGVIDLYQALASYADLPPKEYFLWTQVDDILHVVIGLTLFAIGCYGLTRK